MYLKKIRMPDGNIYLSIMDKYYDPEKKYARVEKIGYVQELAGTYPDLIAYFTERVRELSLPKKRDELRQKFNLLRNEVFFGNFSSCLRAGGEYSNFFDSFAGFARFPIMDLLCTSLISEE